MDVDAEIAALVMGEPAEATDWTAGVDLLLQAGVAAEAPAKAVLTATDTSIQEAAGTNLEGPCTARKRQLAASAGSNKRPCLPGPQASAFLAAGAGVRALLSAGKRHYDAASAGQQHQQQQQQQQQEEEKKQDTANTASTAQLPQPQQPDAADTAAVPDLPPVLQQLVQELEDNEGAGLMTAPCQRSKNAFPLYAQLRDAGAPNAADQLCCCMQTAQRASESVYRAALNRWLHSEVGKRRTVRNRSVAERAQLQQRWLLCGHDSALRQARAHLTGCVANRRPGDPWLARCCRQLALLWDRRSAPGVRDAFVARVFESELAQPHEAAQP